MSDPESSFPIFTRVCMRCQHPINGYGFYSLYGYIVVERTLSEDEGGNGETVLEKIHGCGDPVHYKCPGHAKTRVVPHDGGEIGLSEYARHMRNIAPGIDYNSRTQRYAARVGKKRLGTHGTQELAEQARRQYIESATPHRHYRKKRTEKHHAI